MAHRKNGKHKAAADQAEELVSRLKPAPGPQSPRRGQGKTWNPETDPVQVHAPEDIDK
jgi:hypothetical protein